MRRFLYGACALLTLPALLVGLGEMVFIDDEGIRSVVALEMLWSGNYVAPTIHGDAYLNKPPLWNWVLALSFTLFGGASEFAARLPTVLCVLGFAATAFAFSRRYLPTYLAFVHAMTVVTCGRMLFWDSMLALIDVCFSWVVYTQIMVLFHFGRRGQWWWAFLLSYLLTATGFMLKNLPALVFQGLTVLALLGFTRSWRQFFRLPHLVSGLLCVGLLSVYLAAYHQYVPLDVLFERLFVESGKRTAAAHTPGETLAHVLAFPFEMSYHFLPWTLLLVFLPLGRRRVWRDDFLRWCLLAFAVNLPVYWLSPNVYPRYLLMLFPLLFAPLLVLYQEAPWAGPQGQGKMKYYLTCLLFGAMCVVTVGLPFVPLIPETEIVTYRWVKALLPCGPALLLCRLAWRDIRVGRGRNFLLLFTCFLLLLRLVFNFFVLPPRAAGDERGQAVRSTAYAVAAQARDRDLRVYAHSPVEPATSFYLTQARGCLVPRQFTGFDSTSYYVTATPTYKTVTVTAATDSLYLRHQRLFYPVGPLTRPAPVADSLRDPLRDGMGTGILLTFAACTSPSSSPSTTSAKTSGR